MENIDERIKDVMSAVFGVEADSISEESSQDNIEGWESIKTLDLIVALEEEFGVIIDPFDMEDISIDKLCQMIREEL